MVVIVTIDNSTHTHIHTHTHTHTHTMYIIVERDDSQITYDHTNPPSIRCAYM